MEVHAKCNRAIKEFFYVRDFQKDLVIGDDSF